MPDSDFRRELAQQPRLDSVRASAAAGSGHPTSSMSTADLIAVLLDGYLTLDSQRPEDLRNDHLIFSKGHVSLLCSKLSVRSPTKSYSPTATSVAGLRVIPPPRIPPTDVATGSLGQGLPVGVGLA